MPGEILASLNCWVPHVSACVQFEAHFGADSAQSGKDGRIQVKPIGSGSGSDLAKNFGPDPDPDPVLVKMSGRLASWAD